LDLNADSRLSEEEFISGISPVEPFSKVDIINTVKERIVKKISRKVSGTIKKKKRASSRGPKSSTKSL